LHLKNVSIQSCLLLSLILALAGCSQDKPTATAVGAQSTQAVDKDIGQNGISGHLMGVDRQPMKRAAVLVSPLKGDRIANQQTIEVKADGSYFVALGACPRTATDLRESRFETAFAFFLGE
jgi:hypothetical protein